MIAVFSLWVIHQLLVTKAGALRITSIESGFAPMQLENGTYMGAELERYFTKLTLPKPRCMVSLRVDTLKPLTGAEDLEILYRECPHTKKWKLIHYKSQNYSTLVLNAVVLACEIALVSPRPVSIIDFLPRACPPETQNKIYSACYSGGRYSVKKKSDNRILEQKDVPLPYPLPKIFKLVATKPLRDFRRKSKHRHHRKHRKHRKRQFTVLNQRIMDSNQPKRRVKRQFRRISGNYEINSRITAAESPYQVVSDLTVSSGVTLTVEKGVRLHFHPNIGITVNGRLVADGTAEEPIWMAPFLPGTKWRGIAFQDEYENYKLRFIHSLYGSDGFLEIYHKNQNSWRLVCGENWGIQSALVACRQLGFSQGAIAVQERQADIAVPQGIFWLTNVRCRGSETGLGQCQFQESQSSFCQSTPAFVTCQGQAEKLRNKPSVLAYVNVTSSIQGIKVDGRMPRMSSVLSQLSQGHGIDIRTFYDPRQVYSPEIFKATLVKNQLSGINLDFQYPTKVFYNPKFKISATITTSNVRHGMQIRGRGFLDLSANTYFHNSLDGLYSETEAGSIISRNDLSASNNRYSMKFARNSNNQESLEIQIMKCNMTGHFFGAAIILDAGPKAKMSLDQCQMFENYNGVLQADKVSRTQIDVRNNNFTRNRGKILTFSGIELGTKINILRNFFSLGLSSNHSEKQAVVQLGYGSAALDKTRVIVAQNQFSKNNMPHVIRANDTYRRATNGVLHIQGNTFRENLSPNVLVLDVSVANLTHNVFDNPVAYCEVAAGKFRENSRLTARNNFWSRSDENGVRLRVCGNPLNASLSPISYVPFLSAEEQVQNLPIPDFPAEISGSIDENSGTINKGNSGQNNGNGNSGSNNGNENSGSSGIGANLGENSGSIGDVNLGEEIGGAISQDRILPAKQNPYRVTQQILIGPGTKMTIEQGTTVLFGNGIGLRVAGQLVVRGTKENPVRLGGIGSQNWNGIIFENKGGPFSVLENCIIDKALHAVLLNSDRVKIRNCVISNPVYDGVTITDASGDVLDLEDITIKGSRDRGIRVTNQWRTVNIRRIRIQDSAGHGIDFDQPVMNISLTSVHISNSNGYAVRIDQMKYSRQSIIVNAVEIANHHRGKGGLYIAARDYLSIMIRNSNFYENTVPSLIVNLRCNYSGNYVPVAPTFLMENNIFANNTQIVSSVSLMHCTKANISGNTYVKNNRNYIQGALKLMVEPAREYGKNNFRVTLARNTFRENQGDYCIYLLPMSMYDFIAVFTGNRLSRNKNRRAGLIAGSPLLAVNLNEFENVQSSYELEVEYNDNRILDATQNYWGTNKDSKIRNAILDGLKIQTRGLVQYRPFLTREGPPGTECVALNNCNGNGQCIAGNVCSCIPGYTSPDCSSFTCAELNNCNNNGQCSGPNSCRCVAGWSGADCAIPSCAQVRNCSGNGQCVSLNECLCRTGFTGEDCSRPICGINACSGHGACDSQGLRCVCNAGWKGIACESPDCASLNDCSNHGNCIGPNQCQCFAGYSGVNCSGGGTNGCHLTGCSSHGNCGADGQCSCFSGWTGATCQTPSGCQATGCSGQGTCGTDGKCVCLEGWTGDTCAQVDCSGVSQCSGHGTCTGPNICSCNAGYSGNDCSQCTNCNTDSCAFTGCSGNGVCQSNGQCLCSYGYRGSMCSEAVCPNDCSGKGRCVAPGQCECQTGYTAEDCSVCLGANCSSSCFTAGCSGNGVCESTGVCLCNLDYKGQRCDIPVCSEVDECSNHGRCIAPNICQCDAGYTGNNCAVCSSPNCGTDNCGLTRCSGHGICSSGGGCLCEQGWRGLRCSNPDCTEVKGCFNRGVCVGPNQCECITGYTGNDCSICTLPSCTNNVCDYECVHGTCDTSTGSCRCEEAWTGAACDVCALPDSEACGLTPLLKSVLPSNGPTRNQDPNLRVNALGQYFPKSDNNYECSFGSVSSQGIWQSTTLVSCAIPFSNVSGPVGFSIKPNTTGSATIQSPSHLGIPFTFYNACTDGQCSGEAQGTCFEGSCVCQPPFSGHKCASRAQSPKISLGFLNSAGTRSAVEGAKYEVQLQLEQQSNSSEPVTWRLVQGPPGMLLNSQNGLLSWQKAIGSPNSIPIKLSASSMQGSDEVTWSINVPMTYEPKIDSVTPAPSGGQKIVGSVEFSGENLGSVPVKVRVFGDESEIRVSSSDQLKKEWIVMTDENGNFDTTFQLDSFEINGRFIAAAVHPGVVNIVVPDPTAPGTQTWNVAGLEVELSDEIISFDGTKPVSVLLILKNSGTIPLTGFGINILQPRDKASIESVIYSDASTLNLPSTFGLSPERSVMAGVTVQISDPNFDDFVRLQVTANQTVKRAISVRISRTYTGPHIIAQPNFINVTSSMTNANENIPILLKNVGTQAASGLKVDFQDQSPLFLISFRPANQQSITLEPNSEAFLMLGILPSNVNLLNKMESNFSILDSSGDTLRTISYEISNELKETFNFEVTVVDENTYSNPNGPFVKEATIRLTNPADGTSDLRYSQENSPTVFLSIKSGFYHLKAEAAGHKTVEKTVYVSHSNYQVTVFLPLDTIQQTVVALQNRNGTYDLKLETEITENNDVQNLVGVPGEIGVTDLFGIPQSGETQTISFRNLGDSDLYLSGVNLTDKALPIILITADPLPIISPNETLAVPVTLLPNPTYAPVTGEVCQAFIVRLPFSYELGGHQVNSSTKILLKNKEYHGENVQICQVVQGTDGQVTVSPHAIGVRTSVSCNCVSEAERHCSYLYQPTSACGSQMQSIPHEENFLALFHILKLATSCNRVGVMLDSVGRAVRCTLAIPDTCPGSVVIRAAASTTDTSGGQSYARRKRQANDQGQTFWDQVQLVSKVNAALGSPVGPVPLFQPSRPSRHTILSEFLRFFDAIHKVLGVPSSGLGSGSEWFGDFRQSVGDLSAGGPYITPQEQQEILNGVLTSADVSSLVIGHFVNRWNETVKAWRSGRAEPGKDDDFVAYSDLTYFLDVTAILHRLSTEMSTNNPFVLLDAEMQGLSSSTNDVTPCAQATVLISPGKLIENEPFHILVDISEISTNLQNVKLTLQFVPGERTDLNFTFSQGNPELSQITSVDGSSQILPGSSFKVEWSNIIPVADRVLVKPAAYKANIDFSFSANGRQTTRRLDAQALVFLPKPTLKVFYFLRSTVFPSETQRNHSFDVMLGLLNSGYSDLYGLNIENTRLKLTSTSDPNRMVQYELESVDVSGERFPRKFHHEIPIIKSGSSAFVSYNLTAPESASLANFSVTVLHKNRLLALADERSFTVYKRLGPDMLVSSRSESGPRYRFDTGTGGLYPIETLAFVSAQTEQLTINGKNYQKVPVVMRPQGTVSPEISPIFAYGKFQQFFVLENLEFLLASKNNQSLPENFIWFTIENDRNFVHIADPNLHIGTPGSTVSYDLLFGPPNRPPKFDQDGYRVTVPFSAILDTVVLTVRATDSDSDGNSDKISYQLYGGGGAFSIHGNNGQIKLIKPLRSTDPVCLTVLASDNGVPPRKVTVPVTVFVNSANTETKCEVLTDFDDQPSYTHSDSVTTTPRPTTTGRPTTSAPESSPKSSLSTQKTATVGSTTKDTGENVDPSPSTLVPPVSISQKPSTSTSAPPISSSGRPSMPTATPPLSSSENPTAPTSSATRSPATSGATRTTPGGGGNIIDGVDISELDEEKLLILACKMKEASNRNKQVWGVICDLGKVAA